MESTLWPENATQAGAVPHFLSQLNNDSILGLSGIGRPSVILLCLLVLFIIGLGPYYDFIERRGNKHVVLGDCGWWLRRTMMTKFNLDPNNVLFDGYKRVRLARVY